MKNFQQRTKFRQVMESKPVLVLLGIFVLLFSWSVIKLISKADESAKNRQEAEDKITELQKEHSQLSTNIQNLNTDQGKEEAIRDKFGLAKPGEEVMVVVNDQNPPPAPAASAPTGFFAFLKNLFK